MTTAKYDVAISFLSADESIAAALYNLLSEGLDVFFYPRNQEALAGTDGLESMRSPFLEDSRVVVVLYRERWGETPWTRVEETAIKDGCLSHGWQRLFFVMLDDASPPPRWLPHTHVRFNYANFGIEGAVGAIKARVLEAGGNISPITALKRAELVKQETQYLLEKKQLRSPVGLNIVEKATAQLFVTIKELCGNITASGSAFIQVASDARQCHLRNLVSLVAVLDSYSDVALVVREYDKKLEMPGEFLLYYNGRPRLLEEIRFVPSINRARECGWECDASPAEFLTSDRLANIIVNRFIDLDASATRGEFGSSFESGF